MKRFLFIIICLVAGIVIGIQLFVPQEKKGVATLGTAAQHITQPAPTIAVATPQRLRIPKIGVDAAIESVGMDEEGRMDVPTKVENVAWYNLGNRPGERGSAVIDGHFDTSTGGPAVFYYLPLLELGDTVQVTDANGRIYLFRVTRVVDYPYDQLPMQEIFASRDGVRLNLITCGGSWDTVNKNYSNRTVVYTVLQE